MTSTPMLSTSRDSRDSPCPRVARSHHPGRQQPPEPEAIPGDYPFYLLGSEAATTCHEQSDGECCDSDSSPGLGSVLSEEFGSNGQQDRRPCEQWKTDDHAGAHIARSGLGMLAPEPHRTTRQPAVNRRAEPAFCAQSTGRGSHPRPVHTHVSLTNEFARSGCPLVGLTIVEELLRFAGQCLHCLHEACTRTDAAGMRAIVRSRKGRCLGKQTSP